MTKLHSKSNNFKKINSLSFSTLPKNHFPASINPYKSMAKKVELRKCYVITGFVGVNSFLGVLKI